MKKNVLNGAVFIFILVILFISCNYVLLFKATEMLSKDYQKYGKDKFDIIFVGSSVMKNGVYPMELWDAYGYSSYNLACGNQSIPSSYYVIKKAIADQHPQIIVLDCFYALHEGMYLDNGAALHRVTDWMGGKETYELVKQLVPSEDRLEFLLPITKYHSRWKELQKEDFVFREYSQYGAEVHFHLNELPADEKTKVKIKKKDLPHNSLNYMKKIIKLCEENHVQLLLISIPVDWNEDHIEFGNMSDKMAYFYGIQDLADKYHIDYINFDVLEQEVGLDLENDYGDGFHLNANGAEKMTSYLGAYINKYYKIPDRRGDEDYKFMNDDYMEFSRYKDALYIASITDLQKYISLIKQMQHITVIFSVKDIQGFSLTPDVIDGMKGLGFQETDILMEKRYHSFVGVISEGEIIVEKIGKDDEKAEYCGKLNGKEINVESRTLGGGDMSEICIDGTDYSMNLRGFNIVIMDNISGEIIDKVNFDTHVDEFLCYR